MSARQPSLMGIPPTSVDSGRSGLLHRKCACGKVAGPTGECAECRKKRTGILQGRASGAATDLETVPTIVHDVLGSSGQPLDSGLRSFMEPRFGRDFGQVRVHADSRAAKSAEAVNAQAYTLGSNIVFGQDRYSPGTLGGKRLLAHELTHVVQQAASPAARQIQAKPDDKKPEAGTKTVRFKVKVDHEMDADEVLHEFVRQYYSYNTEAQIQSKLPLWANNSKRGTTAKEVAQGFVIANVTTANQTNFETLDPKEKDAVNAETDKRFWESTGYKPDQKLGTSAKDREMAQVWMGVRNAVLTEDKQRKDIEALPEDIKRVLFAGSADATAVSPGDYTQVLRIARKLAQLSPEARKDYLDRINTSTASLNTLESSIDSYIQFQAQREQESQKNETAAKPLLGAESLYTLYQNYKDLRSNVALSRALKSSARDRGSAEEAAGLLEARLAETETALLAALKLKGFNSIADFEAAAEAYRLTFRTQAVNLALDVLARYEHMLFEEKKKLQQPGAAAGMVKGIAATNASAQYKEYHQKKDSATNLVAMDPVSAKWVTSEKTRLNKEAESAQAQAEAGVISGSGNDPLVSERGTNREKLAGLNATDAQSYLLETIDKRTADITAARQEFKDDPDRVFKLPDLVAASQQIQGIGGDTIYAWIVRDYIKDQQAKHLLSSIATGILALALTFLVPVGGWLAAAALVAGAGISTYQAYAAYKEYEEQEKDYNLHFLSEEPSLFWVGVAIAAAALDLGLATSVVVKESATALKALKGPMMEFSKDSDLAKLVSKIEAADGLKAQVKTALEREAKASLAAKEAFKDLAGKTYAFMPGMVDPGLLKQGFRALYYSVKRGVNTIAKLRADAKLVEALGDITRMSGAERAELEAAFEEVKQLVKAGHAKGMDDASLLGFIDRWAINRGKGGFQTKLFEEMNAWKPLTAEQQKALDALGAQKRTVANLYEQKTNAQEELAELRAKPGKSAEDVAEIRELEKELTDLDPVAHPPKTPRAGKGKIAEAEATLGEKEKDAAKAELTLYDRIRAAAPSEAAKDRTLKGITVDQVGPLKTPPTPLQADHIVSVREIADMDGFADLLWKDQKAIVDMKENLIAMDGSANASKGDRTWRSWNNASTYYNPDTVAAMAQREANVRAIIQNEIKTRLAKLAAGKP